MKFIWIIFGAFFSLSAGLAVQPDAKTPKHAADHILVKIKSDEVKKFLRQDDKNQLSTIAARLSIPAGAYLEENGFSKWKKKKENKNYYLSGEYNINLDQFMYLRLPAGVDPVTVVERLKTHPLVEYAELDQIAYAGSVIPSDENYRYQWYLTNSVVAGRIHAPEAWDITRGSTGVVVAVIDSGCDTNNAEFTGRWVPGWDFWNSDSDPMDDSFDSHGTAVASILLANSSNGYSGAGIDWGCRLMPIKILNTNNSTMVAHMANAIDWAVTNGAKVINLSVGTTNPDSSLSNAVNRAVSNGVIVVSITHNAPYSRTYPGLLPSCIAVGGSDTNGMRWAGSLTGTNIALVAPGTNVYYLGISGSFNMNGIGTSFAAPMVAGAASLICSLRPDLNCSQVRTLLCAGAMDRVSVDTNDVAGWDESYGWGVLNIYNSLILAKTAFTALESTNSGQVAFSWMCPDNASNKLPYYIEYASSPAGLWTAKTNILYAGTNASWADDASATNIGPRFYRIMIKEFKPVY